MINQQLHHCSASWQPTSIACQSTKATKAQTSDEVQNSFLLRPRPRSAAERPATLTDGTPAGPPSSTTPAAGRLATVTGEMPGTTAGTTSSFRSWFNRCGFWANYFSFWSKFLFTTINPSFILNSRAITNSTFVWVSRSCCAGSSDSVLHSLVTSFIFSFTKEILPIAVPIVYFDGDHNFPHWD